MSSVSLKGVSKTYAGVAALRTMDLEIPQGEFLTLLGPSGCGKTTTLRLIAGFIEPSTGRILFGGDDVTDLPPQKREIGMVFQDYALFPHMTIGDNIKRNDRPNGRDAGSRAAFPFGRSRYRSSTASASGPSLPSIETHTITFRKPAGQSFSLAPP